MKHSINLRPVESIPLLWEIPAMLEKLDFHYQEKRLPFFVRALKFRLFERFTRQATPVFLKGGDSISTSPVIAGQYEKELVTLLEAASRAGCGEALIDIGANIGLTTFYAGQFFKNSYCFEPNPKVFCVLTANLYEKVGKSVHLFNFGLGTKDETTKLTIPKMNYGGAFILNSSNAYSLKELASKDGFSDFNQNNYDELPVEIKKGRDVLRDLFAKIPGGFTIKIDVEGFEQTVLEEIAAALPTGRRFAIVFENWSQSFDPASVSTDLFKRPVQLFKLSTAVNPHAGKVSKLFQLILRGRKYHLESKPHNWIGTLLIADSSIKVG